MRYEITRDRDPEGPIGDTEWELHSFSRRHDNFTDPNTLTRNGSWTPALKRKIKNRTAFKLSYYEHGECAWMLKGGPYPPGVEFQWDGVILAGILVWNGKANDIGRTHGERIAYARSVAEEYTQWRNGDIWSYAVYGDDEEILDLGGLWYGYANAQEAAEESMEWFKDQQLLAESKVGQEGAGI